MIKCEHAWNSVTGEGLIDIDFDAGVGACMSI